MTKPAITEAARAILAMSDAERGALFANLESCPADPFLGSVAQAFLSGDQPVEKEREPT